MGFMQIARAHARGALSLAAASATVGMETAAFAAEVARLVELGKIKGADAPVTPGASAPAKAAPVRREGGGRRAVAPGSVSAYADRAFHAGVEAGASALASAVDHARAWAPAHDPSAVKAEWRLFGRQIESEARIASGSVGPRPTDADLARKARAAEAKAEAEVEAKIAAWAAAWARLKAGHAAAQTQAAWAAAWAKARDQRVKDAFEAGRAAGLAGRPPRGQRGRRAPVSA